MSKRQKENVIRILSTHLMIFICLYSKAQEDEHLFTKRFKNCDAAYDSAVCHVRQNRIQYFLQSVGWHGRDPKKDRLLDSVLYANYKIKVNRKGSGLGLSSDYTLRCYDRYIEDHMDSTYTENFYFKSLNIVRKLVGEPPINFDK